MDVEVLKNEKKMILERANLEKRDLTPEEKERCHIIDQEVFNLENKGGFNPTGFIKTSVKVNINAAKDDKPIPHIELKQEKHDVYVPPAGAKEVMEYDKMHNIQTEVRNDHIMSSITVNNKPNYDTTNPIIDQHIEVEQAQPVIEQPMVNQNVEQPMVNQNVEQPIVNQNVEQQMVNQNVEQPMVNQNTQPTSNQTPQTSNNGNNVNIIKKNALLITIVVIIVLLIIFIMSRIFM